jgi:GT2 family glycosyltransferase
MIKTLGKLLFLCLAPALLAGLWLVMVLQDVLCRWKRRSARPGAQQPQPRGEWQPPREASIVITNWNGRDLLAKYLPHVMAAAGENDEIIVVDNASSDGSAEFVQRSFPRVQVLRQERNLGFGGGSNAGVQAARHRVVILLNNDMRPLPSAFAPLVAGFSDPDVFAVSSQIFFSDPTRRREETGLTSGRFEKGFLRVRHEIEPRINKPFPTFYGGGGSTAYDREKFLEVGGFDALFEPFYVEDADLSYGAWRRGWKVLYQPESHLFHEHRATIGKHYSAAAIQTYLQKNYVLMVWKNVHKPSWLASHFSYLYGHMLLNFLGWPTETRTTIGAFVRALRQLPQALRARRRTLLEARLPDGEVFQRVRPCVFRETAALHAEASNETAGAAAATEATHTPSHRRLNVLFVSPYSINPPLHGGAVFMLQAVRQLATLHNIFILTFVDRAEEVEPNLQLRSLAQAVEVVVRKHRPSQPFHVRCSAQRTFYDADFAELLDRMVLLHEIDLIQFEYTQLAQYRLPLHKVPQCLFEHDIYFRSIQRQLRLGQGGLLSKALESLEWLRAIRYEVSAAGHFDAVLTCHEEESRVLRSFLGANGARVYSGLRTAIDVSSYAYPGGPRQPDSLLFVGNFQHRPNVEGLQRFCERIFPLIRAGRPQATLNIVGANAPAEWNQRFSGEGIRLLGHVDDIREPLSSYSVFVCPIWMGAGVRVKILEAFATGIPVVSTSFGAEGLEAVAGEDVLAADSPDAFAAACVELLGNPDRAQAIAASARRLVETRYDWPVVIGELDRVYQQLVASRAHLAQQPAAIIHPVESVSAR